MMLLDTHAAFWVLSEPDRLSDRVRSEIETADVLAVASISWYELAWLIDAGRISVPGVAVEWLRAAAGLLQTVPLTWAVAHRAADLSRHAAVPRDPADRIIYATAVAAGVPLVTKDAALLAFDDRTCLW